MINNNPIPKFDVPSCSKNGVQFFNSITQQDACSRLCCVNGRFHRNGITIPLIRKSFLVSCVLTPRPISSAHTHVFLTWPPFCAPVARPAPTFRPVLPFLFLSNRSIYQTGEKKLKSGPFVTDKWPGFVYRPFG